MGGGYSSAVSLPNNHVLDFGHAALSDILQLLDTAGTKHAGAGNNLKKASKISISEAEGVKIWVIAFTDNEPEWEATEERTVVFYVPVDLSHERAKNYLKQSMKPKKPLISLRLPCIGLRIRDTNRNHTTFRLPMLWLMQALLLSLDIRAKSSKGLRYI